MIPDPYFSGGAGLHEIANGGHMNIHVDFNHHAPMDLEHRLNVLIYLNRDWKEEYGGCFELWDSAMSQCKLRVVPLFNRCVIFNSSATSFQGNPEPIKHPMGASRRSLALYYYTATWDGSRAKRLSQFKARPHSADQFDVRNRLYEFANDLTPPIAREVSFPDAAPLKWLPPGIDKEPGKLIRPPTRQYLLDHPRSHKLGT